MLCFFIIILASIPVCTLCTQALKRSRSPTGSPSVRPSLPPSNSDPVLQSFSLDSSTGRLDLYFDSAVSAPSLNIPPYLPSSHGYLGIFLFRKLTPIPTRPLQIMSNVKENKNNTVFGMTSPFTTKSDLLKQGNTSHLLLYLSADDFARLTLSLHLSTSSKSSFVYLSMDGGVVRSASGRHGNQAVPLNAPISLSLATVSTKEVGIGYAADTAPPYLVQFSLDLNVQSSATQNFSNPVFGLLTIVFSEPINVEDEKFHLSGLTLQNTKTFTALTKSYSFVDDTLKRNSTSGAVLPNNATVVGHKLYSHYYSFIEGSSNLQRTVVYALGSVNMNALRAVTGLCISSKTCHLSGYSRTFAQDLAGNNVSLIGFDKYNPIPVSTFVADSTAPVLLYWKLDSNIARISLIFSESVYMVFFNYSKVVLFNNNTANISVYPSLRVSNPIDIASTDINTNTVVFTLNSEQQSIMKSMPEFLKTVDTSFIFLENNVVVDTSFLQNRYVADGNNAIQVKEFVRDSIRPIMTSFKLDMSEKLLTLIFSKPISIKSIDLNQLGLRSSKTTTTSTEYIEFSPTMASVATKKDSYVISIVLTEATYFTLQHFPTLAKYASTSLITMTNTFATDTVEPIPNPVFEISNSEAVKASVFLPDITVPKVLKWYPDLTTNRISLTLSKPLDISSVDISLLILSSDDSKLDSTEEVRLSKHSFVFASNLNSLTIQLSLSDERAIKTHLYLCKSVSSCYLTVLQTFANDSKTANSITGAVQQLRILSSSRLECSSFIPDEISSRLQNFSVDLSYGQVTFTFSKPIDSQRLNSSAIRMVNSNNGHYNSSFLNYFKLGQYSFSLSDALSVATITFTMQLSSHDFMGIKSRSQHLCQPYSYVSSLSSSLCNLHAESFFVVDTFGNLLTNSYSESSPPLAAATVQHDTAPPVLLAIYLSQDLRFLSLFFNDAINVSYASSATILSRFYFLSRSGNKYPLATFAGVGLPALSATVITTAALSDELKIDLHAIMSQLRIGGVAQSQATTSFYFPFANSIKDYAGNSLVPMIIDNAIKDGLGVSAFLLDMTSVETAHIKIELVGLSAVPDRSFSKIDVTLLTLLSTSHNTSSGTSAPSSYSLTGFSNIKFSPEEQYLTISLNSYDYKIIQNIFVLSSRSVVSILVDSRMLIDTFGKAMAATVTLPCSQLLLRESISSTSSSGSLRLMYYTIDMIVGRLVLYFNRQIILSKVNLVDTIFLQNLPSPSNNSVGFSQLLLKDLSAVATSASLAEYLVIDLNGGSPVTTREKILLHYPLVSSANSTYVSLRKGVAFDKLGSPSQAIAQTAAMRTRDDSFRSDYQPPLLLKWNIDMTNGHISFFFDEAINGSSVQVTFITLLSDPQDLTSPYFTLSPLSKVLTTTPTHTVIIQLSSEDRDFIQLVAPRLLSKKENSFVSFLPGAFYDIANPPNQILVNYFRYGVPVSTFLPDVTPPELLYWNFSYPAAELSLKFNKRVNCSRTNVTKFVLQSRTFMGTLHEYLHLSSSANPASGRKLNSRVYCNPQELNIPHVTISLGLNDILQLKIFSNLAKSIESTYLRMLEGAIFDTTGNSVLKTGDGEASTPASFAADNIRPKLLGFTVNSDFFLYLFFDKPMNISSLQVSQIHFQDHRVGFTRTYPLATAQLYSVDKFNREFIFNMQNDLFRITGDSKVFTSQERSYLWLTESTIQDNNKNALVSIESQWSLQMGPCIVQWDLNINEGHLSIVFSEAVNPNFLIANRMAIQNVYNYSSSSTSTRLILQTSSSAKLSSADSSGRTVFVTLSSYDLNSFKLNSILLASAPQLFLTAEYNLTRASGGGGIVPYLPTAELENRTALIVREFVVDFSPPTCLYFGLDLSQGQLILTFNEPVEASSIQLPFITLFSNDSGNFASLTSPDNFNVTLVNQTILLVTLPTEDLNNIKLSIKSGDLLDCLVFSDKMVQDFMGNYIVGNSPQTPVYLKLSQLVLDVVPPSLVSFKVDLYNYLLTLTFDEIVDSATFLPVNIYLQSSDMVNAPSALRIHLSNYTVVERNPGVTVAQKNSIVLNVDFYSRDSYLLDSNPFVCKNITNSFIAISGFSDIFGNGYGNTVKIYAATEFTANTAPLRLQSFDFLLPSVTGDAYNVLIKLYFSRRVNLASFSCSDYWILSDRLATFSVQFSDVDCTVISVTDDSMIQFTVSVGLIPGSVGTSQDNTYISTWYDKLSIGTMDVYENSLLAIDRSEAIQAGPRVIRFSTDMNTGIVMLILASPVLIPPVETNLSLVGFFAITASTSVFYTSVHTYMQTDESTSLILFNPTYHNASHHMSNGSILELRLSNNNLNRLKMLDVSPENLYLLIDHQIQIVDSYGQYLCHIHYPFKQPSVPSVFSSWGQKLVTRFVADETQPFLESVKLNLGLQTLSLQFDEPIRPSSVTVSGIRIQQFAAISHSQDSTGSYNYLRINSNSAAAKSVDLVLINNSVSAEIIISLTTSDATALKLRPGLAKNISSTFISIEFGSLADIAGNFLNAIGPSNARALDVFVPDTIRPQLLSFLVDMSSNADVLLVLTFSEPVQSKSFRLNDNNITLQSRYFSLFFPRFALTGGRVSSSDGIEQTIHLLAEDVAAIKKIPGLMRTKQSTYMIISELAVTDLAGNQLIPFVDGLALACKTYIPDMDPPRILSTVLDWNRGTLLLSMTEPVNLTAVYFPGLTFQSKTYSTSTSYSLTSTSSSVNRAEPLDDQVTVILGAADLNSLRSRYPLCATHENSWISFTALFLQDFVGNFIDPLSIYNPSLVSAYYADMTRPTLLTYVQDMQSGKVFLTFSESVKTTSVNLSQVVLQNDTVRRFGVSTTLNDSHYSVGQAAESIQMVITFSESTLNFLKFYGIGYTTGYVYLSWSDTFVSDNSRNGLAPSWDSSVVGFRPRIPDHLILDTAGPTLLRWLKFKSTSGELFLKLYFDEPVEFLKSDAVKVVLSFTTDSGISNSPPLPLLAANLLSEYATMNNYNTILTIKVADYCVVSSDNDISVAFKSLLANTASSYRCSALQNFNSSFNNNHTTTGNISTYNTGVNVSSSGVLFSFLLDQSSISYKLLVNTSAFHDFSKARNRISFTSLEQGYPDCSLCPAGQYVASNCTSHSDRVCSPCSSCGEGFYPQALCGLYHNAACVVCASCRYGTYLSSTCSNSTVGANTQCSQCKECTALQYPTRDCAVGLDRLCESCLFCQLPTLAAKDRCVRNGKYQSWYRNNCCFDNAGNQVNCNDVDLQNILLSDVSGRHNFITHPL